MRKQEPTGRSMPVYGSFCLKGYFMRKRILGILSVALCMATLVSGCGVEDNDSASHATASLESTQSVEQESSKEESSFTESGESAPKNSEEEEEIPLVYGAELSEYFYGGNNGNALYVNWQATVETKGYTTGTIIGKANAGELTIDGVDGATLTATGQGVGAIQGAEGTTLVFKNLTIRDESLVFGTTSDRREGYLEFGGKLRFENCTFACAAYLCDDADAEFINCSFDSGAENMYAMWISDGSASFTNCEFTGWRAIKLYEGSDNKYTSVQPHFDVETIVIDGCFFNGLKKKPGLAIDVFQGKETSITIKNTEFYGCKQWTNDSYEGLSSVYESDVDTATLTLIIENVTANDSVVDWETEREFGNGNPNP